MGKGRKRWFWTKEVQDHPLVHFRAGDKQWRLLTHFYGFLHFTDPAIDNYYKRFVRDFLHYHDSIFCAAGKIVKAVQAEGMKRGFSPDNEGAGGFSALHVRRGEFQVWEQCIWFSALIAFVIPVLMYIQHFF